VIEDPRHLDQLQAGEVLVAKRTDPDWEPAMKRAAAIITDTGGRTCHAAIVSRELGIPAVVGAIAFVASDLLLAINRFVRPLRHEALIVHATYHVALFGLTIGILAIS
jgi:hypothetical protein